MSGDRDWGNDKKVENLPAPTPQTATNTHAFHNRGISHDKNGDYESAIADFTTVLKLDANNASAFFNRGSTHDAAGRTQLAIRDYTAAMALDESKSGKAASGV